MCFKVDGSGRLCSGDGNSSSEMESGRVMVFLPVVWGGPGGILLWGTIKNCETILWDVQSNFSE